MPTQELDVLDDSKSDAATLGSGDSDDLSGFTIALSEMGIGTSDEAIQFLNYEATHKTMTRYLETRNVPDSGGNGAHSGHYDRYGQYVHPHGSAPYATCLTRREETSRLRHIAAVTEIQHRKQQEGCWQAYQSHRIKTHEYRMRLKWLNYHGVIASTPVHTPDLSYQIGPDLYGYQLRDFPHVLALDLEASRALTSMYASVKERFEYLEKTKEANTRLLEMLDEDDPYIKEALDRAEHARAAIFRFIHCQM